MSIQVYSTGAGKGTNASGGDSVQRIGSQKIHTFTTIGTQNFIVSGSTITAKVLIIGGGGGGGAGWEGGGGGAGGVLYNSALSITPGTYSVTVGAGGLGCGSNAWPPAAMTSASTTLSGLEYGNGTYTITASSNYNTVETAWKAFAKYPASYAWTTATQSYGTITTNTGPYGQTATYSGGAYSTVVSGAGTVSGEWFGIQLPTQIVCKSYVWQVQGLGTQPSSNPRSPNTWVLAGSNDGTNWFAVDTQTNITTWSTGGYGINYFTTSGPSSSNAYSYFRVCVSVINFNNPGVVYPFGSCGGLVLYDTAYSGFGQNGGNSSFGGSYVAIGGGTGSSEANQIGPTSYNPTNGGSGGGGGWGSPSGITFVGTGTASQGNSGGQGFGSPYVGGGGGGANAVGGNASGSAAGAGGAGSAYTISGTSQTYGGGGGGSLRGGAGGSGGSGGGAAGNGTTTMGSTTLLDASYYGGGGGAAGSSSNGNSSRGGKGYQGIVIISYTYVPAGPISNVALTNVIGTSQVQYYSRAIIPAVLVNPGNQVFASIPPNFFTVAQTAPEPVNGITWSAVPSSLVSIASSTDYLATIQTANITTSAAPASIIATNKNGLSTVISLNITQNAILYTMAFPFTFTTMGTTGQTGPSSITYGTNTPGYGTSYIMTLSSGVQVWTVPQAGNYTFVVAGSVGGRGTAGSFAAGNGAVVSGTVSLNIGELIYIVAGQAGQASSYQAGGGGGTFVFRGSFSNYLLSAGGGGGGTHTAAGNNGSTTTSGGAGTTGVSGVAGGAGGTAGAAGTGGNSTGGVTAASGSNVTVTGGSPSGQNYEGGGGGGAIGAISAPTFAGGAGGTGGSINGGTGGFGGGGGSSASGAISNYNSSYGLNANVGYVTVTVT